MDQKIIPIRAYQTENETDVVTVECITDDPHLKNLIDVTYFSLPDGFGYIEKGYEELTYLTIRQTENGNIVCDIDCQEEGEITGIPFVIRQARQTH